MPSSTLLEVRRLSPDRIYILGGTAAVPNSAQGVLDDVAPVTRLAGADRYETAVKISRATHSSTVDTLYVTAGTSFVEPLADGSGLQLQYFADFGRIQLAEIPHRQRHLQRVIHFT